jgi:hypothetical protein
VTGAGHPPDPRSDARSVAEQRAAIRRFVLAHHPDRGGDPAVFDAGLRALRAGLPLDTAGTPGADVTTYRRRGPVVVLVRWMWARARRIARAGPPSRVR